MLINKINLKIFEDIFVMESMGSQLNKFRMILKIYLKLVERLIIIVDFNIKFLNWIKMCQSGSLIQLTIAVDN